MTATTGGAPRSPRFWRFALAAATVLAVLLPAAAAALHLLVVVPAGALEQTRADGLAAARERTEQVLTFGPDTVEADLERAEESVTGEFGDDFRVLLDEIVEPAVRNGTVTTTTVTRAGVVSAEADRVTALLFLDQTAAAAGGGDPRVSRSRVEVTVERVLGQWLLADLRNF